MGISKKAESFFSPITHPLRYLPATATLPLLVLWFGIGEIMKIIFLFFGIVFYFTILKDLPSPARLNSDEIPLATKKMAIKMKLRQQ